MMIRSPLDVFPVPRVQLRDIWWTRPSSKSHHEHLFASLYAHNPTAFRPLVLEPTASPMTGLESAEVAEIVHHYRRHQRPLIQSWTRPEQENDHENTNNNDDSFILIPSRRLVQLERIEKQLAAERKKLTIECTHAFHDTAISARMPYEYTARAVFAYCTQDIKKHVSQLKLLANDPPPLIVSNILSNSTKKNKKNRKNNSSDIIDSMDTIAIGSTAPQRLAVHVEKRQSLSFAQEKRRQEGERCHMQYAEKWQKSMSSLQHTIDRRADYSIYTKLAVTYGPLSALDFDASALPGKAYSHLLLGAVQVLERFMHVFGTRYLRYKSNSALTIQTWSRGVKLRSKYRHIYAWFHARQVNKSLMHFNGWKIHIHQIKVSRKLLGQLILGSRLRTFLAWKKFAQENVATRTELLSQFWTRMENHTAVSALVAWQKYSHQMKKLKKLFHKSAHSHSTQSMKRWKKFTKIRKDTRNEHHCAITIQRHLKGYTTRSAYLPWKAKRILQIILLQRNFRGKLVRSRITLRNLPQVQARFLKWQYQLSYRMQLSANLATVFEKRRRLRERHVLAQAQSLEEERIVKILKLSSSLVVKTLKTQAQKTVDTLSGKKTWSLRMSKPVLEVYKTLQESYTIECKKKLEKKIISQFRILEAPPQSCLHPDHEIPPTFSTLEALRRHDCALPHWTFCQSVLQGSSTWRVAFEDYLDLNCPDILETFRMWLEIDSWVYWKPTLDETIKVSRQLQVAFLVKTLPDSQTWTTTTTDDVVWTRMQWTDLHANVLLSLYPFFTFFLLSDPKVQQEVQHEMQETMITTHAIHVTQYNLAERNFASIRASHLYGKLLVTRQRDALTFLKNYAIVARSHQKHVKKARHALMQVAAQSQLTLSAKRTQMYVITMRQEAQLYLCSRAGDARRCYQSQQDTVTWLRGIKAAERTRQLAHVDLQVIASLAHVIHVVSFNAERQVQRATALAWLMDIADEASSSLFANS